MMKIIASQKITTINNFHTESNLSTFNRSNLVTATSRHNAMIYNKELFVVNFTKLRILP